MQDMGWCGRGLVLWGGAGHGVVQDMGWHGAGHGVVQVHGVIWRGTVTWRDANNTARGCQLGHNLLWSEFPVSEQLAGTV